MNQLVKVSSALLPKDRAIPQYLTKFVFEVVEEIDSFSLRVRVVSTQNSPKRKATSIRTHHGAMTQVLNCRMRKTNSRALSTYFTEICS